MEEKEIVKKIELKENEDKILKLNSPKLSNSKNNLKRKIKKNHAPESKFEETYNSEQINYTLVF
jgi:hypothetical protein